MDKERQYVAPRLTLFEQEWVFFMSSGGFRALMYLIKLAKQEGTQKNPGRCLRLTPRKAAHDWRVTPEEVEEMERAAMDAEFLVIEDGYWVVTDPTIFQSARTQHRQTAWEETNVQPDVVSEAFGGDLPTDEEILEETLTNDRQETVCLPNAPFGGHTLSQRVESRELPTLDTKKNPIDPPDGGISPKGFSVAKFSNWFENEFKPAYPRRKGGYEWPNAKKRLEALFRAKTARPDCVMEGLGRYRAAMEAAGWIGTEFVKQAASWIGSRGWEDEYGDGPAPGGGSPPRTLEQAEEEAKATKARRERLAR